jgi:hypothetical protein
MSAISAQITVTSHESWVPYDHRMVCPQGADGKEGFHLWRQDAKTLNKNS